MTTEHTERYTEGTETSTPAKTVSGFSIHDYTDVKAVTGFLSLVTRNRELETWFTSPAGAPSGCAYQWLSVFICG